MLSNNSDFKALLLLHGRDRRFSKLLLEELQLPTEIERIDSRILKEKKSVELALSEWKELEAQNNSLEKEIISVTDLIHRQKSKQLQVKKNEEYTALENEIEVLKNNQNKLEDQQIDVLLKIDDAREVAKIAEEKISLKILDFEKQLESLVDHSKELRKEIEILEDEISEARKSVLPSIIYNYDRVKKVVSRPPFLAPVEDQKCTGCNLRVSNEVVSSILVEQKLTTCDQCGRIVYVER